MKQDVIKSNIANLVKLFTSIIYKSISDTENLLLLSGKTNNVKGELVTQPFNIPRAFFTNDVDSKNYQGNSYFNIPNQDYDLPWQINISINPHQVEKAIPIIAEAIYKCQNLKIGCSFFIKQLIDMKAHQKSKQFTLTFTNPKNQSEKELLLQTLQNLLNQISEKLAESGIKKDPEGVNPEHTEYSKVILDSEGNHSYFSYCYHKIHIIFSDHIQSDYQLATSRNNDAHDTQKSYFVKKSYFESLSESQKHNPILQEDIFAGLQIESPKAAKKFDSLKIEDIEYKEEPEKNKKGKPTGKPKTVTFEIPPTDPDPEPEPKKNKKEEPTIIVEEMKDQPSSTSSYKYMLAALALSLIAAYFIKPKSFGEFSKYFGKNSIFQKNANFNVKKAGITISLLALALLEGKTKIIRNNAKKLWSKSTDKDSPVATI